MRDPIEELENFTSPGLPMDPMPASEVRRRGTRRRRRNTALATIGGIAAVAVIATPLAVLASNSSDKADLEPATDWHQTIPADFPLTTGMPNGSQPSPDGVGLIPACGDTLWAPGSPGLVDVNGASYAGENSSDTQDRSLAVYVDDVAATKAFATLHDGLVDCPVQPGSTSESTFVNDVQDADLGTDASFVFTNQVKNGGMLSDLTTFQVALSGNALFLASSHTSSGGPQAVEGEIQRLEDSSASVIDQLCVFSADGCGTGDSAQDDADTTVIPDDFDLLAGLPEEGEATDVGRVGPDRELAPIDLDACGTKAPEPGSLDRLRGDFRQAVGIHERQLMTFSDGAAAQAYVDSVAGLLPCSEDGGRGVTGYYERRDTGLGDSGVAGFLHYIVKGDPGLGYEMTHVVRVGSAVLLSRVQVDGDSTPVTDEVQADLLAEAEAELSPVVDAMVVFHGG
jgi:hypothetical protein